MNAIKVLLLEDEAALAEIVCESLQSKGFIVQLAPTIAKARSIYHSFKPAILLLDIMLPDGNGFDFASDIRKKDIQTPIIFLTSRSRIEDVVHGFETGGNDYLKKPFSMAELIVRMKALVTSYRVITPAKEPAIESYEAPLGNFIFSYPSGILIFKGAKHTLSSREADILHQLIRHKNSIIDRKELLLLLWGNDDYFSGRSLDVFISKLRKYLKQDSSVAIVNIRGKGYRLVC